MDRAHRRLATKRGGKVQVLDLGKALDVAAQQSAELIALDEALRRLSAVDPRKARVVELRFFAGLGVKEVAKLVGISPETAMRDWKVARAWLLAELSPH